MPPAVQPLCAGLEWLGLAGTTHDSDERAPLRAPLHPSLTTAVTTSDHRSAEPASIPSGLPCEQPSPRAGPIPPSAPPHTIVAVLDEGTPALDPIRSLGAQLWVTELGQVRGLRRLAVDGWISDWRRRTSQPGTSVGFAFELDGNEVHQFRLLFHGRASAHPEVTSLGAAVQKLQVAVKLAQGRIVLVESVPAPL